MALDLDGALALISSFEPDGIESYEQARTAMIALIRDVPNPAMRTTFEPGHLTASAIVLSPDKDHVLLVHHKRLLRWLQPGGHIEARDTTLEAAARREVFEETGASLPRDVAGVLLGLDVHAIPAARGEPEHLHHDVLFGFVASEDRIRVSEESHAVQWAARRDLDRYEPDAPLARTVLRAFARLA
ncbi:MAG: NUDIX domain-containing protein [Planctomycetes bacterium]|nr:NUDIX domain-containing protein [Planctomycetota bacterium]MCB9892642.1 NUDIX domain-containing protein [Planctomycetota bacterium]MCB9919359.1 NUDIX domain-containing protein [Planctomycetota bacterium]